MEVKKEQRNIMQNYLPELAYQEAYWQQWLLNPELIRIMSHVTSKHVTSK